MTPEERRELTWDLFFQYKKRFGQCISIPFHVFDFTEDDYIEEIKYSLETGIPFDRNSPRWRWEPIEFPTEGIVM